MSRPRKPQALPFAVTHEDGSVTEHVSERIVKAPPSIGGIPRGQRALDIICPQGHHFAVVPMTPQGGATVIYVARSSGLVPMLVVDPGGFGGALVDPEEPSLVRSLGGDLAAFGIVCRDCQERYQVLHRDVVERLAAAGRKKELHLGAPTVRTAQP